MSNKVTVRGGQLMRGLVDLERQLFLAGMLTSSRAAQLRVAKAALEAALDFVPDIHGLREAAEAALATDTGVARTIEAKMLRP